MSISSRENRIESSILMFAFGDAYGYVTEFMSHKEILKTRPEIPEVLKISDDTQMSLYTLKAIENLSREDDFFNNSGFVKALLSDQDTQNRVRKEFAEQYLVFAADADNNRSPGGTVMRALAEYETSEKVTGMEGSESNYSLGCGTVMRAPWIGLLPYPREVIMALSILQAQTTHGDPAGWLISAMCSLLTHDLLTKNLSVEDDLIRQSFIILNEIESMSTRTNLTTAMTELNDTGDSDVKRVRRDFFDIAMTYEGDVETLSAHDEIDITSFYGQGWIANEALYNAIIASSMYANDESDEERSILRGIKRLVYTNGDSDSIAAIGGSLMGAMRGMPEFSLHNHFHLFLEPRYRSEISSATNFVWNQWKEREQNASAVAR